MTNGLKLLECEKEFTPLLAATTSIKLAATVYEVGGTAPTTIIHDNQDWYVIVEWEMTGPLVRHFCGKWRLSVNLESIGPDPEYKFPKPPAIVDMDPCGDGKYSYRIDVAAGDVASVDADGTLYILGVTLGSQDACKQPSHIFAHCTGGELQFVPGPPHSP